MIWCQTGKNGDVLSLLPILHNEFKTTGNKSRVLIAKEFARILGRTDYVEPVIWDGDWQDLRGAVVWSKQRFSNVIVPQIFGKDFPIAKHTPSFQLDQWLRAGYMDKWDTLPMVINRPNKSHAIPSIAPNTILYADHSQGSPFPSKDELYRLLVDHFGSSHKIKRLSEIRCDHPLDLLALFDAADALVTVDTMMLHLSAASNVPTIAMVADSPTLWKGVAWSKRFLAHIRYTDFVTRKAEIVDAVKRALNKSVLPKVELIQTAHKYAYNPSIATHGGTVFTSYRFHPEIKSWRTEIAMTDGVKTWTLDLPKFNDHSLEDMRLFTHRGRLHASLTVARNKDGVFKCVCGYGEVQFNGDKFTLSNFFIPHYGRNDFSSMEKNFCFWDYQDRLFCTYLNMPHHVVLEVDKGKVIKEYKTPAPKCDYGMVRGGTQSFPYNGGLLRFAHALQRNERSDQYWTYHICGVVLEPQPPFSILKISSKPILSGTEQYFHWPRYKPRVLIPYGAVANGDGFKLSVGCNDSACATVNLTEKDLNL